MIDEELKQSIFSIKDNAATGAGNQPCGLSVWSHILETSEENLRKISHLRTVFDNIWESTNQT